MRRVLERAAAAAATEATVLITGESGTGKDLLARWIHRSSPRRSGPFVTVNCAALPEGLAESELFGHERGAFTGALDARPGQIALAGGGTLLLDEVNEAPPSLQPKLLRVLQEREVHPVGGLAPRAVDLRILATTQRELRAEVAAGRFREDLFYRLDVIVLRIPPLRERPADVPELARALLARLAAAHGAEPPRLGERALRELARQPLRGNVRELANLMRRAVVLAPGREVELERLLERRPPAAPPARGLLEGTLNLRELERRAILRSLAESGGNRTEASRALGISVRTLRNKIRAYGLA
jgi:two-component system response regulator FlrC